MSRPLIRIYTESNVFIDREMNDEEFDQYEKDRAEDEARLFLKEAAKQKKATLLDRLGITEEEAKLLLA